MFKLFGDEKVVDSQPPLKEKGRHNNLFRMFPNCISDLPRRLRKRTTRGWNVRQELCRSMCDARIELLIDF
jgi:hypothetical protein